MNSQTLIEQLKTLKEASKDTPGLYRELSYIEKKLHEGVYSLSPWDRVLLSRDSQRPTTLDIIQKISHNFIELHGDRYQGDDPAIVGGFCQIQSQNFVFIGHEKGHVLKENISRRYAMGGPEGYRKALRLAKQAEKFSKPLLTFINTPGAYPGLEAEERGIGEAIARNLKEFFSLSVPILVFIIGEGGSGGALGLGIGDRIFMMENATYSVISPEGFASILLKDTSRAQESADLLKLTAHDHLEQHLIDDVLYETIIDGKLDVNAFCQSIRDKLLEACYVLLKKPKETLIKERQEKFLAMTNPTKS